MGIRAGSYHRRSERSGQLNIAIAGGVDGARQASGTVVVIDVLRAFSVSAYALAGGATACRLVADVEEARTLAQRIPGSIISAEIDGLPVPGCPISNSPTQVCATALTDRVLIQRSSAGTQAANAAAGADRLFVASLVVAGATARAVLEEGPASVTLVPSRPDHGEDQACARYLEAALRGETPDVDELLEPLRSSERYQRLSSGAQPGFPATDVELALIADRFDFAMPVTRDDVSLLVRAQTLSGRS